MKGQKTGGRKAGTPNKLTSDIKLLCQEYTRQNVETLVAISLKPEHKDQVRATEIILAYAHGKPAQTIDGNITGNLTVKFVSGFGSD